uniref:Epithelial stromal interaction 1 n=1 Tax=Suricata suricatta TaxID=37032 RepID=A0A673T0P9_SURSU
MFTRTRAVGSGLGASSAPRPARDPSGRPREPDQLQGVGAGSKAAPQSPSGESPGLAGPRPTGAYTLITPNENRRNQIQRSGSQSEAEVRQKQQLQLMRSKYQQKLKREEYVRSKKRVEEAKFQQMKAIQRQKSSKLEEKERLQENLRREAFREHRQYKTAEFLSRLDTELPDGSSRQMALHDPQSSAWKLPELPGNHTLARSWAYKDSLKEEENKKLQKMKEEQRQKSELLEFNRQQQEEERTKARQVEHRRVNNAFLDRLQGKSQPGGFEHSGGHWNMNSGNSWDV